MTMEANHTFIPAGLANDLELQAEGFIRRTAHRSRPLYIIAIDLAEFMNINYKRGKGKGNIPRAAFTSAGLFVTLMRALALAIELRSAPGSAENDCKKGY
jgi:hypothetical protein